MTRTALSADHPPARANGNTGGHGEVLYDNLRRKRWCPMLKILLIRPDYSTVIERTPPLGLLYLAAVARREFGAEVRLWDPQIDRKPEGALDKTVRDFQPDVIGISSLTGQKREARKIAGQCRKNAPQSKIILGGPYATVMPFDAIQDACVDYVVIGEGERVFTNLLRAMADGSDPSAIPGLALRREERTICNLRETFIENLDDLPFPAHDLADMDAYSRHLPIGAVCAQRRYFPIVTSRGCPYKCIYCHDIFGKRFRARGIGNILAELDLLARRYGIREVHFMDDIINVDRKRMIRLMQSISSREYGLKFSFPNGIRGDILDEETVDEMKRAGVYRVSIAVETASPRMQKDIGKNLDLARVVENIRLLERRRIMVHGFFMLGFPDESPEEIDATLRFARRSRLHSASFFFVNPLPGSELHRRLSEQNENAVILEESPYYYRPVNPSSDTKRHAHLRRAGRLAALRFYMNGPRLFRIVRDIPRKSQLLYLIFLGAMRSFLPALENTLFVNRRLKFGDNSPYSMNGKES
jgi:anaerobic magnesium-protoporphyrin IX monomethyl ester cyclase